MLLVVAAGLAAAPRARADEDSRREARAHYEQGLALANRGAYAPALREFRSAYEKSPQFAVLYNIGQAEIAIGHPLEAIDALSRYLREGGDQIAEERRKQVETQIALVKSSLAELVITSSEPGARVTVDGRELGSTPLSEPLRVKTGEHEVSLLFPGVAPIVRSVALSEGERRSLHFERPATTLVQAASPSAPAPVCRTPAPGTDRAPRAAGGEEQKRRGPQTTVGYVLVGTGVALGVASVATYFLNQGRYEDWSAEQAELSAIRGAPGYAERQTQNNELADSIERANAVTVGFAIAGGVLAAGGAVLVLTDTSKHRPVDSARARAGRRLRLALTGSAVALSGAF